MCHVRRVDGERVGGEPLHAQRTLQLHVAQLPPALLVPGARQSVGGLRPLAGGFLGTENSIYRTGVSMEEEEEEVVMKRK